MKAIESPRTNNIGNQVAYVSPYGQCYRTLVIPRDRKALAQGRMRAIYRPPRAAGSEADRRPAGTAGSWWRSPFKPPVARPLRPSSGQQLCIKINSPGPAWANRRWMNPRTPSCSAQPRRDLAIVNDDRAVCACCWRSGRRPRTSCSLAGPHAAARPPADEAPAGRVSGPAGAGDQRQRDITCPVHRPVWPTRPGQRVSVVTCRRKNGWKARTT